VIGDSSMSHPAADPTVPTVINRQARLVAGGVAEVGFRVSFSKTLSLTAGTRLAGLVSDPPYVAVDP
jgi:hypothetical protein